MAIGGINHPLPSLPSLGAGGDADPAEAAQKLEAFFLRRVLAEVRPEDSMLEGGFAGGTFREMLDGALADKMAESGGLGLANVIERELSRAGGAGTATSALHALAN